MKDSLIASALPPLDPSTFPYYAVLLYAAIKGAAKGYEWLTRFLAERKKDHDAEIGRATEGARMSREEAVHLAEIQDKTIARLEKELSEAEHREAEAVELAKDWEVKAAELAAKLGSAGRQWFEREGVIDELGRRLKKLEDGPQ